MGDLAGKAKTLTLFTKLGGHRWSNVEKADVEKTDVEKADVEKADADVEKDKATLRRLTLKRFSRLKADVEKEKARGDLLEKLHTEKCDALLQVKGELESLRASAEVDTSKLRGVLEKLRAARAHEVQEMQAEIAAKADQVGRLQADAEADLDAIAEYKDQLILHRFLKSSLATLEEVLGEGLDDVVAPTSAQEAVTEAQYGVMLEKTKDSAELGIDVDKSFDTYIVIVNIKDGLVQTWNQHRPDQRIMVGDKITQVNGHTGDPDVLYQRLQEDQTLAILLERQAPSAR